tara:strand:- start:3818 stop:4915 length:1098 start_codon:yes stop_codon:yes gene_type:complete
MLPYLPPHLRLPIVFVLLVANSGCTKSDEAAKEASTQSPPAKVETTKVVDRWFADEFEALGTVRALEAIDLSSNVTERVASIHFEDGDAVEKGKLLVQLENSEEMAILRGAEAQEAEQEREIKRLEGLVQGGAVSEVRLEEHLTRRDIARQAVEEARAQIQDRQIKAPFDGVLGFRRVSAGALVEPGDLIATLDILDPVKLDFTVPETFLSDLKSGLELQAETEAFPGELFSGKVTQIDTRVNPVTRSATVRAEVPNPNNRLRPGMLMTTTLVKRRKQSLSVPERSLVSVLSDHFVFVLNGEETVKRVKITIGRRVPGFVEVLAGLTKGDTIVTDGLIGLVDGRSVEITGTFDGPSEPYQPSSSL